MISAILYVALVAAGVFAAWQIRIYWLGRGMAPSSEPQVEVTRLGMDAQSQPASGKVADFPAAPLDLAHLKPFAGDPLGIVGPAGAKGRGGFSQKVGQEVRLLRSYEYEGELPAAAEHYRRVLSGLGFASAGEQADGAGGKTLIFVKDRTYVTVALRKGSGNGKIKRIVVTAAGPDLRAGGAAADSSPAG